MSYGITGCFSLGMNSINAIAAGELLPLNQSHLTTTCQRMCVNTPSGTVPPRMVDQVTWSPGLWWLLYRYEYLFEGLIPEYQCHRTVVVYAKSGSIESCEPLASAHPHWGTSGLLNPPPALATLPPRNPAQPIGPESCIKQSVSVGAFVDLVA